MAWFAGTSRKTCVVPLVGQLISSNATRSALPRPIVCCKRVGAEAAARRDVPVDGQRLLAGGDHLDAGADGRPVGLLADQLHRQPVVALAGVLEQDVVVLVAGHGAAHLDEDVDVAVAVPVAAGDAVPLLQVPGAGRGR